MSTASAASATATPASAPASGGTILAIPPPATSRPATSKEALDRAVAELQAKKGAWAELPVPARAGLLRAMLRDFQEVAPQMVEAAIAAKGIPPGTPAASEEWLGGPLCVVRNLRLLIESLEDIAAHGRPLLPAGAIATREDGQVTVRVYPKSFWDKQLFAGFTADIWLEPGVRAADVEPSQAANYRRGKREGKVALVLGAGNVASIGPMDVLYKLFHEDEVCVLKMNPVNEYLGPFVERGLRALVESGFLRVVYGGAEVGSHLCNHPGVDSIHITGSDKTHDAIVWGPPGPERDRRKAAKDPLLKKPITSELGNVSPVIVVPGPWSEADIRFHAQNVATQVANNASFNCNAAKLIVQQAGWPLRERLLAALSDTLRAIPPRRAYYPGAGQRYDAFLAAHPEADALVARTADVVPWTLIAGVDPARKDEICFSTEAFCGVLSETGLESSDPIDFLRKAVAFANDRVWGTLNACVIVHPDLERDPAFRAAFDAALRDLRYGTIGVNHWPALGYGLVTPTWGAYPGHTLEDIQSGRGTVHNTFMLDSPQKSVVRGPFRVSPRPAWFATHRTAHRIAPRLVGFEAKPSIFQLPGIVWNALRG